METDRFKFNPHDPCVANKIMVGEPLTAVFCVDDVKSIHKDTKVVEKFEQWIGFMYEDPNIGKVKSVRGKFHEYLSTPLDYTTKGEVKIDMQNYVKKMINGFPIYIPGSSKPGNQKYI